MLSSGLRRNTADGLAEGHAGELTWHAQRKFILLFLLSMSISKPTGLTKLRVLRLSQVQKLVYENDSR